MVIIGQHRRLCLPDDAGVTGMEREAAIEHIQEKLDLLGVGKVPCHRLKHPSDHHREISLPLSHTSK